MLRTSIDLHIERVPFGKEFWKVTVLRLHAFFLSAILPELAIPRLHKGEIWEPSEWLKDVDSNRKQKGFDRQLYSDPLVDQIDSQLS